MVKVISLSGGSFHHAFACPGCGNMHGIDDRWTWNGDVEKPTIRPSVHVPNQCHSFVTDGMIQFLNDCSHKLAGQTVPLEDV